MDDRSEYLCSGAGRRLPTSTTDRIEEQRPHDPTPAPCSQGRNLQRVEAPCEAVGTSRKTAIDRIVAELAEADSWEELAQRAAERLT